VPSRTSAVPTVRGTIRTLSFAVVIGTSPSVSPMNVRRHCEVTAKPETRTRVGFDPHLQTQQLTRAQNCLSAGSDVAESANC